MVHAGKLGQVTNFTIVLSTASISRLHGFVSLRFARCDTAMQGGLHARLCHTFLVISKLQC